jgi:hypothetical protein
MSKCETAMTLWYWNEMGGTLIEEFSLVPKGRDHGARKLDALIVLGAPRRRLKRGIAFDIAGKHVIVVQTKNSRLNMSLLGQAFFSARLLRNRFHPASLRSQPSR